MRQKLIEDLDFYYNKDGFVVMTERYHLERGFCCGNGCKHCPYNYQSVPEPKRSELLEKKKRENRINNS